MGYDLQEYAQDLEKSNEIYFKKIKAACVCPVTGEILKIDADSLEEIKKQALAVKAQYIGAAGKRLRSAVVVELLETLRGKGYDITPSVAVAVAGRLLGRGVNRKMLMARFATAGRTAANKADPGQLETLASSSLFEDARKKLADRLSKAQSMRSEMQKNYKNSEAYALLSEAIIQPDRRFIDCR